MVVALTTHLAGRWCGPSEANSRGLEGLWLLWPSPLSCQEGPWSR